MPPPLMNSRISAGLLFLALAPPVLAAAKEPLPKPALRVDTSPVGEGRPGVVTSYADVVDPVQRAVVSVYSAKTVRQHLPPSARQIFGDRDDELREEGLGSGVIVSPDGYILTNNHVVAGADELEVALPDDREFRARVIGTDPKTDVAIIKIEATGLPTVVLADSDKLRVGDVVFAIGNPLNVGQTVTMGIVSALGRKNLGLLDDVDGYENFIQTDAPINMGNSGGALVDARGRLVGINSAIVSTNSGSMGIGFAIPVNLAASIMRSLMETGTVTRGFLGVGVQELTPELADGLSFKEVRGVVINSLTPDGPAAKAGLKLEDVIVAINDQPVDSLQTLRLIVAQTPPGTKVRVKSFRNGKPASVEVTLSRLADDQGAADEFLSGVLVARPTDDLRRTYDLPDEVDGLMVTEVSDDSAYRDRFRAGMVIVQVNRTPAEEVDAVRAVLRPGRNFCLVWDRGGYRFIPFQMP